MGAPQTKEQNFVLGSGYIYFDAEDASGNLTGLRYVGDTPNMSVTVTPETVEVYDSDGPIAEKVIDITTRIELSGTMIVRDIDDDNLASFLMGVLETVTQTTTPVADESIASAQQGYYYQLGQSISNPTGVRDIGSVVVTSDPAGTTHVVTTDYVIDTDTGMLYIVPGGGITNDDPLLVSYTPVANTRIRMKTNDSGAHVGALKFIADNTVGENREVYIPKVELSANGELAFKSRDDVQEMTFDLNILKRTGYEQVYIDGVAA